MRRCCRSSILEMFTIRKHHVKLGRRVDITRDANILQGNLAECPSIMLITHICYVLLPVRLI